MNQHAGETSDVKDPGRWFMLAGVWLIYFSFGLTISGLAPLVAPIIRDLGISHTEMGSVLGAWQLIYIFSAIPCGMVVDRLGPRRALLVASLLMAGSGFARSGSADYATLIVSVAAFGIGGPMVSSGAPKVISDWFSGEERGLAMGVYITGPAVAAVLTLSSTNSVFMPLLDGDWRAVLRVWATVTLLAGVVWFVVSAGRTARGAASGDREGRAASLAAFGQLLSLRQVQVLLGMSICIFAFNHGLNHWLPELLRSGGMSPAMAGYWAAVPTLVGIAGSLLIPRVATPGRRLFILAGLAASSGIASLCLHATAGPLLMFGLVLQGIARSSLMTVAMLTLIELPGVDEKRVGMASGLFFSAAEIGGVLGPLSIGVLYDASGGFTAGLFMLTGLSVLVLTALATLRAYGVDRARAPVGPRSGDGTG